ncbi:MAG: GNAT family N-acetyltransferase [Snowella sp.]|nr:GNAT family N-acetyltransferase [Snowella sp.]
MKNQATHPIQVLWETERLIIREWNPALDAAEAFWIYGDREVMHFIREPEPDQAAVQKNLEDRVKKYRPLNNGTGCWAIVEKATQIPIGTILLVQLPDSHGHLTQDYEIGWHLRRDRWEKGYATEAARKILDYGFQTLKLPIIYAVVRPDNAASIRVTQRLGMEPVGLTSKYYGLELALFQLSNPQS